MKMKITWRNLFRIGILFFALYLCIHYLDTVQSFVSLIIGAATPFFIGFAIAYVVNILMSFYEKIYFPKSTKKAATVTRKPLCMTFAFISLAIIAGLIIYLVVPKFVDCIKLLAAQIPPFAQKVISSEFVTKYIPESVYSKLASFDFSQIISKGIQFVASGIGDVTNVLVSAVSSVVSGIVTAFISIIFAIYILASKEKLTSQVYRLIHAYLPKVEKRVVYVISVFNQSFKKYIIGQATEALILGVLCTLGMLVFGFPYAGMIGALVGFTAIIPVAGAYIGAGVGAFMMLTESPVKALLFLVFILVLQQLEGNLIYPKVVGDTVGLPAIWVLAAVIVGGALFGVVGMLIAVPLVAGFYRLLREDVQKRENEMKILEGKE